MAIHSSKTQFSLTILKAQFSLAISKPNSDWQHPSPILIGNIKKSILIGTTLSKRKEPKIINAWQRKKYHVKMLLWQKKDHGNHLMKKLIESYLEDYVLVL